MRTRIFPLMVAFLASLPCTSTRAVDDEMFRWVPPNSNVVSVIRMGELLNSPYGRRQRWVEEYRAAYEAGIYSAPRTATEIVRATEYRPLARESAPIYTVYRTRIDVSMADVARHELSQGETIGGATAVYSRRGTYFVQLGRRMLGALQPPDRQLLARWLRFGEQNNTPKLPSAIAHAIEREKTAQLIVAADLTDMIDARRAHQWLSASPAMKDRSNQLDAMSSLLATLRGVSLAVVVENDIQGRFVLDFDKPIEADADLLRQLVLEWLDESGARMDVLASADARIAGSSLVLSSQLDGQAFRRILSLIQTPQPQSPSEEGAEANAIASKRYYQSVVSILSDLDWQNRKARDYERTALWHENYAVQIENLSTLGVDPQLVAWGYDTSNRLRALAASLRGVPLEINELENAIRYDAKTWYRREATTPFGYWYRPQWLTIDSNLAEIRAAQAQVVAKDAADRAEIWRMINEDTAKVKRAIEEKYEIDLDKR